MRRVFNRADAVAVRWADEQRRRRPSPWVWLQHRLFDRLVYAKVPEAFSGGLALAICGGAALEADLGRFFDGVGITVLQGYGLTEAAPIVSGGPVGRVEHGTVGYPHPETTARVADDGEILVSGPQGFRGYCHQPAATEATLRETTSSPGSVTAPRAARGSCPPRRCCQCVGLARGRHPCLPGCIGTAEHRQRRGDPDAEAAATCGRGPPPRRDRRALPLTGDARPWEPGRSCRSGRRRSPAGRNVTACGRPRGTAGSPARACAPPRKG